jgi:hypothetical protein
MYGMVEHMYDSVAFQNSVMDHLRPMPSMPPVAAQTDGFSYAALRECWVHAGAVAASEGMEISRDSLLASASAVRREIGHFNSAVVGKQLGFGSGGAAFADEDVPF